VRGRKRRASPSPPRVAGRRGEGAISTSTHGDRQWTEAMLANLLYCQGRVEGSSGQDLETEWRVLYPHSLLTARNLKSRLTVYQRTHTEKSLPREPVQEKEVEEKVVVEAPLPPPPQRSKSHPAPPPPAPGPPPLARSVSLAAPSLPLVWTEVMVADMFDCLDQAREELDSTVSGVVNPRWLELWLARHPHRAGSVTVELLHSRYLDHVKQASRTLGLGAREVEEVE